MEPFEMTQKGQRFAQRLTLEAVSKTWHEWEVTRA